MRVCSIQTTPVYLYLDNTTNLPNIRMMLIITILGITTAISLSYFNSGAITTEFWKRILVLILIFNLILLFISNGLYIIQDGVEMIYSNSIFLDLKEFIFLVLLLLSVLGIMFVPDLGEQRYLFVLTLTLGSVLLICSTDYLNIFLGLELQSYSVYLLAASCKNYEPSENAGLKYFLLGALSSTFILMGFVLLYMSSGSSSLTIAPPIATPDTVIIGLLLVVIGVMWKIAAAPLHAWSIDVYDAVPGKITAALSLLPKIGLFSFAVKLIHPIDLVLTNSPSLLILSLKNIVIVIIVLSFTLGSILGLRQSRVKRLLAYSSVLNVGFILMSGVLINNSTAIFYTFQYIITTVAIWCCLTNGFSELTLNTQLQNVKSNKILALCLTLLILSTAGIPPMVGFFAKYDVILLAVQYEYFTLAIIAIIASLISTVYYLNLVKFLWFKSVVHRSIISHWSGETTIVKASSVPIIITLAVILYLFEQQVLYVIGSIV